MTSWNNSRRWPFQLYCPRTQDLGDIVGLIDDHVDAKSRVRAAANVLTWPAAPVVLPVCTTGFHRCAHRLVELGVSVHRWASSVRAEERRDGKEGVSTIVYRWATHHKKHK